MENIEEEVINKTLDDNQFKGFEKHLIDSSDRMVNNSLIMFMFLTMYRSSGEDQKQIIVNLVNELKKEVENSHLKKAELTFNLTKDQYDIITTTLEKVTNSSLGPILQEFRLVEKSKNE